MKKHLSFLIMIVAFCTAHASIGFSSYRGVWSSDSAEAVITDSVCIFYFQADSTMQAILEIPSAGFSSKTVFAKDGTVTSETNGVLDICGYSLKKVEEINIITPYEMAQCNSKDDVGKCLQQWRLGAGYGISDDMIYCE